MNVKCKLQSSWSMMTLYILQLHLQITFTLDTLQFSWSGHISTLYKNQKTLKTLGSSKITISNYTHMISHCTLSKKSVVAVLSHFFEVRTRLKGGVWPVPPTQAEYFLLALVEPPVKRGRITNNVKSWNGTLVKKNCFDKNLNKISYTGCGT